MLLPQLLQPRISLGHGSRVLLSTLPTARLVSPFTTLPVPTVGPSTRQLSSSSTALSKLTNKVLSGSLGAKLAGGQKGSRGYTSEAGVGAMKAGDLFQGKTTSAMFSVKKRLAAFEGA